MCHFVTFLLGNLGATKVQNFPSSGKGLRPLSLEKNCCFFKLNLRNEKITKWKKTKNLNVKDFMLFVAWELQLRASKKNNKYFSYYLDLYENKETIVLRISDHHFDAETEKNHPAKYTTSVTFSNENPEDWDYFKADPKVKAIEYVYYEDKVTKDDLISIAKDIIEFVETGKFTPSVKPNEINESPKPTGNNLLGTSKSEDDTAALKLLESVKDTELKKIIKSYFSAIPKNKGKVLFLCFSKNAAYVSNGYIIYKIKCNVPKDLVGKSSSNKTFEQVESIFTSAEKNKQGIKYQPNTFSREHIKYMFDKYDVLKFSTCKYYFGIGGQYFDTEYLQRCLKHSGKVFKSSLWVGNNILYSQSDEVDYILMPMCLDKSTKYDLTLVDYINDKVIEEYNVTNSIEYNFETDFDFFNKVTLEKFIKYALRVVELKRYEKDLNYFKQLNNAYKLLTGKECAEIPNVNLNVCKDNKLNLSEFISDDELRPFMWCIGYQNGYACATDSYLLVAVKDQYIKSREGKTYNILGYEVKDYTFPTTEHVIKEHFDPYKRITFDFERLKKAITLAKKLPKGTAPIVQLESGVCFNADKLEKVLYFLDYCTKPEIYLTKTNVLYIKDKNEVHNLILSPINCPIENIHVSIVDLKYHYNPNKYWGKEKDKIDAVVKGNCVTPEDTKLQRLELQMLEQENKNTSINEVLSGLGTLVFGLGSLVSNPTKQTFYENLYKQLESIVKDDSFEKNGIRNFILSHIPEDYKNDDIEGIVEVFYQRLKALKCGKKGLGEVQQNFKELIVSILSQNGYTNGKDYTIKYYKESPYWKHRTTEKVQECWIRAQGYNFKVDEEDFDDIKSLTDYVCGLVDSHYGDNKKNKLKGKAEKIPTDDFQISDLICYKGFEESIFQIVDIKKNCYIVVELGDRTRTKNEIPFADKNKLQRTVSPLLTKEIELIF